MQHSDTVLIEGLEIQAVIGVYEAERHTPQRILLDIEIGTDFSEAVIGDDLAHTIDYAKVVEQAKKIAEEGRFKLLEALLGRLAYYLEHNYPITALRIRARKPDILPNVIAVGAEIQRTFQQDSTGEKG